MTKNFFDRRYSPPQHEVQTEVGKIVNWSFKHDTLLLLEKTIFVYAGSHQPLYSYAIHGSVIKSRDNFMNLGVQRSFCAVYSNHCEAVAHKASKVAVVI